MPPKSNSRFDSRKNQNRSTIEQLPIACPHLYSEYKHIHRRFRRGKIVCPLRTVPRPIFVLAKVSSRRNQIEFPVTPFLPRSINKTQSPGLKRPSRFRQ